MSALLPLAGLTAFESDLLLRVGVAFALGLGVALLHRLLRRRAGGAPLAAPIAILAPLITLVVAAVSGDLARAFGLVGVLAIVRFRTVVREPVDTVFVLFAVAAGVTSASLPHVRDAALGCAAVAATVLLVALLGHRLGLTTVHRRLLVRVAEANLAEVRACLAAGPLLGVRSAGLDSLRGGGVVEARFDVAAHDPDAVDRLVLEVARLPGVHRVRAFSARA